MESMRGPIDSGQSSLNPQVPSTTGQQQTLPTGEEKKMHAAVQDSGVVPGNTATPSRVQGSADHKDMGSPDQALKQQPSEKTLKSMVKGAVGALKEGLGKFASTSKKAITDLARDFKNEIKDGTFVENRKALLQGLAGEIGIGEQQRPLTPNDQALSKARGQLEELKEKRQEMQDLHQQTLQGPVADLPREYMKENNTAHMNILKAQKKALEDLDSKISALEAEIKPMVETQSKEAAEFREINPTLLDKAAALPGKIKGAASRALKQTGLGEDKKNAEAQESKPLTLNARLGALKKSAGEKLQGIKNAAGEKLGALQKAFSKSVKVDSNTAATQPSPAIGSLKKMPDDIQNIFREVDSSTLASSGGKKARKDFMADSSYQSSPPVISKSEFVPSSMAEHLMRDKKDGAIGVKYVPGDSITNMEGAMHTFLTPITEISMTADYKHEGGHKGAMHSGEQRQVIMSAAIHPDFENQGGGEVVMRLIEVKDKKVKGRELPEDFAPLSSRHQPESPEFQKALPAYEDKLRDHMVYHLTASHGLPSLSEVKEKVMTKDQGMQELERIIKDPDITDVASALAGKFMNLNGHVVSLEAFYNIYLHQMRNEFSVLESALPQGYVYTIDPPAIFAAQIGTDNVAILNRLQLLALKELNAHTPLTNLKVVGFNNFADKGAIGLYQEVFPDKEICPKAELFQGPEKKYSRSDHYALVEHNNSDAFGQNIETEGPSSKDGVLGSYSDAAHHLKRDREDLMQHVV